MSKLNMSSKEAMEHLEILKGEYKEFDSVETKEEDVQALDIAIEILREVVQGVKTQEQLNDIYPTQITLTGGINDGITLLHDNTMIDSSEAIKIDVKINSSKYDKSDIYKAIKITCEKLTEYFH